MLWLAAAHFVDDFFGCEGDLLSHTGFHSFQHLRRTLGYKMKEAKAQPPAADITLLGVDWEIRSTEVRASPGAARVQKLLKTIGEILQQDRLTQEQAAKLAGKLGFVSSWMFGSVGKPFLRPLFVRQHATAASPLGLSRSLKASLVAITKLLRHLKPVSIPLQPSQARVSVLYADAFVTVTGSRRPANQWLQTDIRCRC